MAKMTSLSGAVTGKLAGNVYSVNAGQQIVRAYQPNVANPSTELQVNNRAKFKLASQLSAALSPVIAISKNGMVSGRNQFLSATMGKIRLALGNATIPMQEIQLTKSAIQLPALRITSGQDNHFQGELVRDVRALGVSKMIYVKAVEEAADKIMVVGSQVVSEAGDNGHFSADLGAKGSVPTIFYAYGIIEEETDFLTKYADYQLENATFIASLVSSRSGVASGLKTTTTSSAIVNPE